MEYRTETDMLGSLEIENTHLYGVHTKRALNNFCFNYKTVSKDLIIALAIVKQAAVMANHDIGFIDDKKFSAINMACEEIIAGKYFEHFPISALQGGAGTSLNMNINEVIANRSLEILGKKRGEYSYIDPIETINLHQSTNDVYPTAVKIALIFKIRELSEVIAKLQGSMQKKEKEFEQIILPGRTEFQNAVPITLGAQFASFAEAIGRDRWRSFKNEERLRMVNIGGTAVGTGLTAPREYIFLVIEKLRSLTGLGLARAEFVMDQTANSDSFVEVSGILAANATNLFKIG
jgi:aspartate ammonia-lyase